MDNIYSYVEGVLKEENLTSQEKTNKIKEKYPNETATHLEQVIRTIMKRIREEAIHEAFEKYNEDEKKKSVISIVDSIMLCKEEVKPLLEMIADVFIERWLIKTSK